ncbi:MAG: hypothetical protein H0T79_02935 [Deltaproteobacteria bacterium]|nr:hypothetical protein [Deltaproteobacteria bacterium]
MGLERRDKLHPQRITRPDRRGAERLTYLYDPKEVAKIPKHDRFTNMREPGETAARCFELLDIGKTVNQIVIELRETPDSIDILRDKWLNGGGASQVISPIAWEALEQVVGPFASVTDLVDLVTALAAHKKEP